MAVRFKLDKCGIKLSLAAWQLLAEDKRREFLCAPCDNAADIAGYRQDLCFLVEESTGDKPRSIPIAEHPPWAAGDFPEEIRRAMAELKLPPLSSMQWRTLTGLQRFALLKLSRAGRDHRDLGSALREFGVP